MMGGASRSTGRRSRVRMGPRSSRGRPRASTTRPSSASPTGTSRTRPVRRASAPACKSPVSPSRIDPRFAGVHIKGHAQQSAGKADQFLGSYPRQAGHQGNAVTQRADAAHLLGPQSGPVGAQRPVSRPRWSRLKLFGVPCPLPGHARLTLLQFFKGLGEILLQGVQEAPRLQAILRELVSISMPASSSPEVANRRVRSWPNCS